MRNEQKGLTLIEIMIALALLSIVLALGYTLYFFATDSFALGETQSHVQYDVRMASSFITSEVRNATSLALIATPTSFSNGFHYIFIRNNRLVHRYNGVETVKTDPIIIGSVPATMFQLKRVTNTDAINKNTLEFTIVGNRGTQQHSIKTKVLLNNLLPINPVDNQAIRYVKP